jgi:hypothetical protein
MKRLTAATFLLLSLVVSVWVLARGDRPVRVIPALTGEPEYCVSCHANLPEISPAHPVETFGCVICHGGERLALEAGLAHSTMRGGKNPSDLAVAVESCGGERCHSGPSEEYHDHVQSVMTSVQATYAGAIAQVRHAFGAQPDLTARQGITAITDDHITSGTGLPSLEKFEPSLSGNAALKDFADNCLFCHLSAEPMPGDAYARLTGCAACHTPTAGTDLSQPVHKLTTAIPYTQCNTCHNRGNYSLAAMEFRPRTDRAFDRLEDYYQPIAQFVRCEWTLDCIDCHSHEETMGDGDIQSSQSEIQYVQCRTCHGTLQEKPLTRTITNPNDLALRLAFINPVLDLKIGDTIVVTGQEEPFWNLRAASDGSYEMYGKATGERFVMPLVYGSGCEQKADEQQSQACHVCHQVARRPE